MLQKMRSNLKGTVAFIVVGFLAFIMAASLVNLTGTGGGGSYGVVAEVNGKEITERELQLAISQEKQRLLSQFGENLPAEFLADERLRAPALDGLVQRYVLLSKASNVGMSISDQDINANIMSIPEFGVDGIFNSERYVQSVRRIGHTPVTFRQLMHDDFIVNQLRDSIISSAFVTESDIEKITALSRQTRDFSWISLPLKDLPEQMEVSEEEVQAFYDENKSGYNTQEKVAIEYISLTVDDIASEIEISDIDVEKQFELELESFAATIQREAAHIMIEGDDDAAQEKITKLQEKLDAGEDFASLAAEYSDDFGTKDNGGNLGVSSGDSFPSEFELAIKSLQAGEISGPVEVDGATHFIKLIAVEENQPPTLDGSRARIISELKTVAAEEIFIEKLSLLRDISYNAENLGEVGDQLDLSVGQTALFSRSGGPDSVLSDGRVVNAAFSERVLQERFTSEVIELQPDHAVVINLIKHEPVRTLTLEEKREDITAKIKLDKAKQLIADQGNELKIALQAGDDIQALAEEKGLEVKTELTVGRESRNQPTELIKHVFSLERPEENSSLISSLYLNNNDFVLVSLTAVNDASFDKLSDEEKRGASLSLERSNYFDEFRAWQSYLSEKADIDYTGGDIPLFN